MRPFAIAVAALAMGGCIGMAGSEPPQPMPGSGDSGTAVDAGAPDAGPHEAGLPTDSGVPDAGSATHDAGAVDAGRVIVYSGWPFDATEAARRQNETATALGLSPEVDIDLGGGVALTMVVIPAGQSQLGCTDAPFPGVANASDRCEGDETLHAFTLPKPLLIMKTVFTVAQHNALAPTLPDSQAPLPGDPQLPALLPYRRAQDIIRVAVQQHAPPGWVFRLPTLDEWEYAARAGVTSYFTAGNTEADLAATAWYKGNSGGVLHNVMQKTPNAWDVHDVIGNAWTWVWYTNAPYYGDDDATTHIVRGCPFSGAPLWNECRLSNRMISTSPEEFRFVADVPTP
jgi:formylglycine-generating enzyme required for sulfatase activity